MGGYRVVMPRDCHQLGGSDALRAHGRPVGHPCPAEHQVDFALMEACQRLALVYAAQDGIDGRVRFDWMQGGFFLVQDIDLNHGRRHIKGVEYIGYDADTETLRSHVIDNHGSNFAYT